MHFINSIPLRVCRCLIPFHAGFSTKHAPFTFLSLLPQRNGYHIERFCGVTSGVETSGVDLDMLILTPFLGLRLHSVRVLLLHFIFLLFFWYLSPCLLISDEFSLRRFHGIMTISSLHTPRTFFLPFFFSLLLPDIEIPF